MRARGKAHAISQPLELRTTRLRSSARERRTRELMHRVRRAALYVARSVPAHIDRDEIVSAAYLGLAEALRKLGPEEGPSFERYALLRARGAILDYLRSCDVLTRGERSAARRLVETVRRLTAVLGRLPTEEEVDGATRAAGNKKISAQSLYVPEHDDVLLVDQLPCSESYNPEVLMLARRDADCVRRAMNLLPQRMRRVLELVYFHDARLRDIGVALGVTESRACQLRQEAMFELRLRLPIGRVERVPSTTDVGRGVG